MENELQKLAGHLDKQQGLELANRVANESLEVGHKLGGAISDLIDAIFDK